jgi:hypothetical protein
MGASERKLAARSLKCGGVMHKVGVRANELSRPFRRFIPQSASIGWTWTKIAFPAALGRLFIVGAMAISGAAASNGATPNGSDGGGAPGSGGTGGAIIGPPQVIRNELAVRDYRFSLLSRVTLSSGEDTDFWAARDALVSQGSCAGVASLASLSAWPQLRLGQDARAEPNHPHPIPSRAETLTICTGGRPGRMED